jgi:hypothetical protein
LADKIISEHTDRDCAIGKKVNKNTAEKFKDPQRNVTHYCAYQRKYDKYRRREKRKKKQQYLDRDYTIFFI